MTRTINTSQSIFVDWLIGLFTSINKVIFIIIIIIIIIIINCVVQCTLVTLQQSIILTAEACKVTYQYAFFLLYLQ